MLSPIPRYRFTSLHYGSAMDHSVLALDYNRLEDPAILQKSYPNVEAILLDFKHTALAAKNCDHYELIKKLCQTFRPKYLEIRNSKRLTELPKELKNTGLQWLKIVYCPKLVDLSTGLSQLSLQSLEINSKQNLSLGRNFYESKSLEMLNITCLAIEDMEYLSATTRLKSLKLALKKQAQLPFSFTHYTQLELLSIIRCDDLITIPSLQGLKTLKTLELVILPKLQLERDNWAALEKLETLTLTSLSKQGSLLLPDHFDALKNLHTIDISHCNLGALPNTFGAGGNLTNCTLKDLAITTLPTSLMGNTRLSTLSLGALPNLKAVPKRIENLTKLKKLDLDTGQSKELTIDFSKMDSLERLQLFGNQYIRQLPPSLSACRTLIYLNVSDFSALKTIEIGSEENTTLALINIENCRNLEELSPAIYKAPVLNKLHIKACRIINFPAVPIDNQSILTEIKLTENISIPKISPSIAYLSLLTTFTVPQLNLDDKHKIQLKKILYLFRATYSFAFKKKYAFFYWLFNTYRTSPVTKEISSATFELLQDPFKILHPFILKHIPQLNANQQAVDLSTVQGTSISLLGKTAGLSSILKKKLKSLGFSYTTKRSKKTADYHLIGANLLATDLIPAQSKGFLTEAEIYAYCKTHQPELLQKADVPVEYIENLKMLLNSKDSLNENVALTIMRASGLPDELIPYTIIVAKTTKDKNLRSAFKRFLKGKINKEEQAILSYPYSLNRKDKNALFRGLYNLAPTMNLEKYAYLIAQRTGQSYEKEIINYGSQTYPKRAAIIDTLLVDIIKKGKALNIALNLNEQEINSILEKPLFQGNLERVRINSQYLKCVPSGLAKHATIKQVEIYGGLTCNKLSPTLCKLSKLKELIIYTPQLKRIPEQISQLKRLKTLTIYSEERVALPESFASLGMLQTARIKLSLADKKVWMQRMPNCSFR